MDSFDLFPLTYAMWELEPLGQSFRIKQLLCEKTEVNTGKKKEKN